MPFGYIDRPRKYSLTLVAIRFVTIVTRLGERARNLDRSEGVYLAQWTLVHVLRPKKPQNGAHETWAAGVVSW